MGGAYRSQYCSKEFRRRKEKLKNVLPKTSVNHNHRNSGVSPSTTSGVESPLREDGKVTIDLIEFKISIQTIIIGEMLFC